MCVCFIRFDFIHIIRIDSLLRAFYREFYLFLYRVFHFTASALHLKRQKNFNTLLQVLVGPDENDGLGPW